MSKLFVDCDDTLVLWRDATQDAVGYLPNHRLILAICNYLGHRRGTELVVWSSGGEEYARGWAREFFPGQEWWIAPKNMRIPQAGDVCIDDQLLVLGDGVTLLTWQHFVEEEVGIAS